MFFELAFLYLAVTCVVAAPPTDVVPLEKQPPTVIPIVSQSEELEANGSFKFSYETANGIKREETSYEKVLPKAKSSLSNEAGEEGDESNEIHVQQGSYSYTAPDGTVISVRYIADENGFRPIGDHLPKPPSVPIGSGRRAKTLDTAESRSAPAPVAAAASEVPISHLSPDSPKAPETPKPLEAAKVPETPELKPSTITDVSPSAQDLKSPSIESRTGEVSSTETADTSSTPEETKSTADSNQSTTEQVTSTEVTTSAPEKSTTPEEVSSVDSSTTEVISEISASEPSTTKEAATTSSTPVAPSAKPDAPSSPSS